MGHIVHKTGEVAVASWQLQGDTNTVAPQKTNYKKAKVNVTFMSCCSMVVCSAKIVLFFSVYAINSIILRYFVKWT